MARNNRQPRRNNHRSSVKLLQRPEDGLEAFMDASMDAFLLFDENLDLLNINSAGERMLDISKEGVEGKNILDFAPEIKKTGRYNKYLDVLRTGDPFFAEDIFPHPRFGDMHLSVKAFKMRKGLGMIVNDITERKRIEKTLKLSERYFRALTENASDGIAVVGGDGTISYESPSFKHMLGYEIEERKGKSSFELVHPDDLSKAVDLFTELIQNPSDIVKAEIRGKHKDGSWRTLEVVGRNLLSDPAVDGIVANFRDITERRQMEESLRESELMATATIEEMADGIVLVGMDGKVAYVNQAFENMLGYKVEELVGTSAVELPTYRGSKDKKKAREALKNVIEKGSAEPIDMIALTKDGKGIPISFSASVIKDGKGNPKTLVAVIRDITKRRKAEEELRRSEEYFRALMENSLDAVTIMNEDGTIRYESPSYERLLGFKQEERVGGGLYERIHPDDVTRVGELFAEFLQNRVGTLHTEVRAQHKDGSWRFIEAIGSNLLDDPVVKGIVINLRDITERKQAEEALLKSEKRLRDIVENSREWIWEVDTQGEYTYSSPIVESILGYTPEEILEKHFYDLFHPDDRESLRQGAFEAFARKEPFHGFVNRNVSKGGKTVWLSTSGIPILDNAGNLMGYRGSDTDITENKKAEEELQSSEEKLRLYLDSSPDAIYILDAMGNFLYGNIAAEKATGYAREEIMGRDFVELGILSDEQLLKAAQLHELNLAGKPTGPQEYELTRKDGSRVFVEISTYPVGQGDNLEVIGIARDTTERRKMESELRLLSDAVRITTDSVAITDMGGSILDINEAGLRMYGLGDRADFVGRNPLDAIVPEDRRKALENMAKIVETGQVKGIEYHVLRKDGSRILIETSVSIIKGEDGKPKGLVAVARDITEHRGMEEELAQSEAKYRSLIETAGAGVATTNLKGEFVLVNEALCNMIGYSQEELLGENFADFLHPHDVAAVLDLFSRGLEGSKDKPNIEFRVIHKDGHDIWCYSSPTPLVNQNETVGFNAIIYDITQRKRAEEALRESGEKLRLIFESITDGIVVTDSNGVIIEANEGAAQIGRFGSKEAMLGKSAFELIAPPRSRKGGSELAENIGTEFGYEHGVHSHQGRWL